MDTKDELHPEPLPDAALPDATVEDVAGGLCDGSRDPAVQRDYSVSLYGAQLVKQGK